MPQFQVRVGRDARVYYKATVEATTLADAMSKLSRHGYKAPEDTLWIPDGHESFDNVEVCEIMTGSGQTLLATYEDGEGWEVEGAQKSDAA